MAKRAARQRVSVGLFDTLPMAPAPGRVPVALSLTPEQQQRQRLVAASLQRDIDRFQQQLARPLASWDEQGHQAVEANVAVAFVLKSLAEFLPADLRPLVAQFLDLRAQVVLREFQES